ncbi:MAG: hypothetical protein GXX96_30885 [Planctomycetaceae bacterium]|nr:hypothetical protein [Planctomycetaceae bacterium]
MDFGNGHVKGGGDPFADPLDQLGIVIREMVQEFSLCDVWSSLEFSLNGTPSATVSKVVAQGADEDRQGDAEPESTTQARSLGDAGVSIEKGSYEGNGENGESDDRRTSNDPTHDTLRTRQQFSQMTLMIVVRSSGMMRPFPGRTRNMVGRVGVLVVDCGSQLARVR